MSAYFYPLIFPPTVITEAGTYLTRCGESVTIDRASTRHDFGCVGSYDDCGTSERWHKTGRISASRETSNDIVRRA